MLKGTRTLNKAISTQLAPFGISRCVLGTEYSYSFEKNDIMFKLDLGYEDELFSEFVKERFNFDDTGIEFLFSLLHEVGHSCANEEIEGFIFDFCQTEKERIFAEMETAETDEEVRKLEWQYFNLPDEICATAWAVNYANTHWLECQFMWVVIKEAILKFYKVNGVTAD